MTDAETFERDLLALGYRFVQHGRTGVIQYSSQATRYLTYWVHWNPADQIVLFTWELAIGEILAPYELQIGAAEELNQFLFPRYDARGP